MRDLFLLVLICAAMAVGVDRVLGQSAEQSGMIKTADGILVVWNEPTNIYTIEIKGRSIKPVPEHDLWFMVDGKFFQIVTARKSEFLKDPKDKNLDDKAILTAHETWESDYLSELLNHKLNVKSDWIKLPNGMTAFAWSYDAPQMMDNQTAKRQLYLLVVKGDWVFGLNTVVEKDGEEEALKKFLMDTMSTLRPGDKPLSLEKAGQQVRQSK